MKKLTILWTIFLFPLVVCASKDTTLIKKGEYLSKIADCFACHTADKGEPYGGGVPFITPFGNVYSTNISSDKKAGIGSYTYEEFYDALHKGIGKHGNLYPAMPFTSFYLITDEDTKALYAYMMSIKPVSQKNRDNKISFPFNIRAGLKTWNLVNLSNEKFVPEEDKSEKYNRGNYLINSLGHCGECHTPRNSMMAMDKKRKLEGNLIVGYVAPSLQSVELRRQEWTLKDLVSVMKNGYSRRGTVLGHMTPIIYHSLSNVSHEDLEAMASYLLDSDEEVETKALTFNGHDKKDPGYLLYTGYCTSCHGINGEGIPNTTPALAGNATLNTKKPLNTMLTIIYGIKNERYSQTNAFGHMPSYNFTDEEMTNLINYLQKTFTNIGIKHSLEEIQAFKEEVIKGMENAEH